LFVVYAVAQLLAGLAVGIGVGIVFVLRGGNPADSESLRMAVKPVEGLAGVAGVLAGGIAVAAIELGRGRRSDPELRRAIGWSRAGLRSVGAAAACGALIALAYMTIAGMLWPPSAELVPGPMTRMALTPGWQQETWRFAVLAISPPIEEFLFRGVLLAGLAAAWGSRAAAVVTALLFVSLHYFDVVAYLPAIGGLAAFCCVALYFRARTGSLAPPIAAHFGYNLMLVVANAIATHWNPPA
jgi:membrane protease YdiL (CAAX protease family)